jgi:hypothetical protein
MKKNTEVLIDASKEDGLEVIAKKTRYRLMSCHQNAEQDHNLQTANRSLRMCQN